MAEITDRELPEEFRSANSVPVERATIKRDRMIEILAAAVEADRQQRGEPDDQMFRDLEARVQSLDAECARLEAENDKLKSAVQHGGKLRAVAAQSQPSGNPGELPVVNQSLTTESDREAMADEFEAWWINVGQYLPACRGANYKKTFAYRAYEHAYDVGFRAALAQQPSGQALEDAERYRWLRNENADISRTHTLTVVIDTPNGGTWVGSDLDAAIDAARAAKEQQ